MRFGVRIGRRRRRAESRDAERYNAESKYIPAGDQHHAFTIPQDLPILAAFSASHHHSDGSPEWPYFGSGSA